MHWREDIPHVIADDGKVDVTVWAGELEGKKGLPPTPKSWATSDKADIALWHFKIQPGGEYKAPAANLPTANRSLYYVEGEELTVAGKALKATACVEVDAQSEITLKNTGSDLVEVLLLQGAPIGEPVAKYGPFVMNTMEEIQQAFMDYRATEFGGWPWEQNAVIFPKEKPRFALLNGKESYPPSVKE
jgi:redox-sensitive bicupin YhaK (pirin superfamily)